jgi:arylsulfatase A-like enzyme
MHVSDWLPTLYSAAGANKFEKNKNKNKIIISVEYNAVDIGLL